METRFIDYVDTFQTQYLCQPYVDKWWAKICKAAEEYEERCELFDRCVCSVERDGEAIPTNGHELALININARKVRKDVMDKYCIDWEQLKRGLNCINV